MRYDGFYFKTEIFYSFILRQVEVRVSLGRCLYPYRIVTVLEVLLVDQLQCLEFYEWFLNVLHDDDNVIVVLRTR